MAKNLALDEIRGKWFNVLANRWFQPLTHVSARALPRDRRDSCQRRKRGTREEHRFVSQHRVLQSVHPMFPRNIGPKQGCNLIPALSKNAKELRYAY